VSWLLCPNSGRGDAHSSHKYNMLCSTMSKSKPFHFASTQGSIKTEDRRSFLLNLPLLPLASLLKRFQSNLLIGPHSSSINMTPKYYPYWPSSWSHHSPEAQAPPPRRGRSPARTTHVSSFNSQADSHAAAEAWLRILERESATPRRARSPVRTHIDRRSRGCTAPVETHIGREFSPP